MEFRECEADMDIVELRADILHLRELYESEKLAEERNMMRCSIDDIADLSVKVKQQSTALSDNDGRTRRISFPPGRKYDGEKGVKISFTSGRYPAYVVSLSVLQHYERLPLHEDALQAGGLDLLTPSTMMPSSAFTYFVRTLE